MSAPDLDRMEHIEGEMIGGSTEDKGGLRLHMYQLAEPGRKVSEGDKPRPGD